MNTKLFAYLAVFGIGLGIRLLAFMLDMPFENDVRTFQLWADMLAYHGPAQFYYLDAFTDYPPVYMYFLWWLGNLRTALGLELLSPPLNLITFMPAILSDVLAGLLIYRWCSSRVKTPNPFGAAFWVTMAYVLNPNIILNSAVWGQVDGIHTLMLVVSLYGISKAKWLPLPYLLYGVAVLTKPQSLIVAPIIIYSAFRYWRERAYSPRAALTMGGFAIATFALMAFITLPFTQNWDFSPVINQYINALGYYPHAAVNAYNFFALTGGNWHAITPFYALVGWTTLIGVTLGAFWFLHRHWSTAGVFFTGAFLNGITFIFATSMHERYFFPVFAFLLMAFVFAREHLDIKPKGREWRIPALYGIFSVTVFANAMDVLLQTYDRRLFTLGEAADRTFLPIDEAMALIAFAHVVLGVYFIWLVYDIRKRNAF